jgi:hypothetical protein
MDQETSEDASACVVCGAEVPSGVERCQDCPLTNTATGGWKPVLGMFAVGVGAYLLNRIVQSSRQGTERKGSHVPPPHHPPIYKPDPGTFAGTWCSKPSLSSLHANEFFLQVKIDHNGAFRGIWESYTFMQVATGAFGTPIAGGYRSKVSSPATGELDFAHSVGWISLSHGSRQDLTIDYQSPREIRLSMTPHGVAGDTERLRSTILR